MKNQYFRMTSLRGQSIIQYTAIMGIVTAAVVTMGPAIKRTIQAGYKNVTDKIGGQAEFSPDPKRGFVDMAVTQENKMTTSKRTENNGDIILDYKDETIVPFTQTNSHYGNPPQ